MSATEKEQQQRVSAVLLAFNCRSFIGEALRSTFAQDFEPLEIIVSDDASTDGTFEVLEREVARYDGPHKVFLRRRSSNSGSKSAHLNDVLGSVSGEIVVLFDGDDVSEASRIARVVHAFRTRANVQAVYSAYRLIDARGRHLGSGNVPHPPPQIDARAWFAAVDAYASGGTLAVRRSVFDAFGDLPADIHEDVVLPFRASLLGSVVYLAEELVHVRRHPEGLTQDYEAFSSLESYRTRLLEGIAQARRQRDSRIGDLEKAQASLPHLIGELDTLREVVRASMTNAETSAGLVSSSFAKRVRAFWNTRRGTARSREGLARDLALVLAPAAYLRYKRRRLAAGRRAPSY